MQQNKERNRQIEYIYNDTGEDFEKIVEELFFLYTENEWKKHSDTAKLEL